MYTKQYHSFIFNMMQASVANGTNILVEEKVSTETQLHSQYTTEDADLELMDNNTTAVHVLEDDYGDGGEEKMQGCCCRCFRILWQSPTATGLITSILTMLIGLGLLLTSIQLHDKDVGSETQLTVEEARDYMFYMRSILVPTGTFVLPDSGMDRALQWMVAEDPLRPVTDEIHLRQRFALATMYYDWSGPRWNIEPKDGWLKTSISTVHGPNEALHECDWLGVRCNERNHIIELVLDGGETGVSLTGTISTQLSQLSSLQEVQIRRHPSLTGDPSESIASLTQLKVLNLAENNLSTFDFTSLSNLVLLERLDLSQNNLVGTVTDDLMRLSNLEELALLTNPELQGNVLEMVPSLPNLTGVVLSGTACGGTIPFEIGQNLKLKYLFASGTNLRGEIPSTIGLLTNLESLVLEGSPSFAMEGSIPTNIGALENLLWLSLSQNNLLETTLPTEIGQLTKLRRLEVFQNPGLHGEIPTEVGRLTNLETLDIFNSKVLGQVPNEIVQMTSMETIDVRMTRLTGTIPEEFCELPSVERVLATCRGSQPPIQPCSCCDCSTV